MRVFKTKWFARFALKEDISGKKLIDAVREAEKGLNDGELRGGLIKKRVARAGEGKRGAF
ncbi:MAG: type II toxin-antitoxin system RelE/ParE family toxin [Syntrophobacteraceae bacterium]